MPCWGNTDKVPKALRVEFFTAMLRLIQSGKPVMHLGVTNSGDPKHPLMLAYETPLQDYAP